MGGRGQSSMTHSLRPDWQNNALAFKQPETLKEAIGEQGASKSIRDSYKHANPYYSPNIKEYSYNCQRSVVAYELRRRGYDVIAQETYKGDSLPRTAHIKENGGYYGYWMGSFKNAKSEHVGAKTKAKTANNIEKTLLGYGNGARAIISVTWKKGNSVYVFDAEVVNVKIIYVDAQTGRKRDIMGTLNNVEISFTHIIRTDNLRISERARKAIRRRK